MIAGPDFQLVEMLVHELAHQKFYLRGDSDLKEAFATAVAEYGTLRWLLEMNGLDAFYEEVEALGGLDPDERRLRLQDWRERASEIVDSYGAGSRSRIRRPPPNRSK